jgi:hypothetical protein
MVTRVVNLYNEPYDIYIGRAGKEKDGFFGNPFWLNDESKRDECIEKFRKYFYNRIENDPEFKKRVENELLDKVLGCFCAPRKCHGDVYIEYLENLPEETKEQIRINRKKCY